MACQKDRVHFLPLVFISRFSVFSRTPLLLPKSEIPFVILFFVFCGEVFCGRVLVFGVASERASEDDARDYLVSLQILGQLFFFLKKFGVAL
jgi:hypothetical protein